MYTIHSIRNHYYQDSAEYANRIFATEQVTGTYATQWNFKKLQFSWVCYNSVQYSASRSIIQCNDLQWRGPTQRSIGPSLRLSQKPSRHETVSQWESERWEQLKLCPVVKYQEHPVQQGEPSYPLYWWRASAGRSEGKRCRRRYRESRWAGGIPQSCKI